MDLGQGRTGSIHQEKKPWAQRSWRHPPNPRQSRSSQGDWGSPRVAQGSPKTPGIPKDPQRPSGCLGFGGCLQAPWAIGIFPDVDTVAVKSSCLHWEAPLFLERVVLWTIFNIWFVAACWPFCQTLGIRGPCCFCFINTSNKLVSLSSDNHEPLGNNNKPVLCKCGMLWNTNPTHLLCKGNT